MTLDRPLDPRVNAFREDLAHRALSGLVAAATYADPVLRQCVRGVVPLLARPEPDAPQVSQIRYGEFLDVLEWRTDGFAWVQNRTDSYVGYLPMPEDSLSEHIATLSERISVLRTFIYAEPHIKATPLDEITLGSFVQTVARQGKFVELVSGGYVFAAHVVPSEDFIQKDYVFTAGRFLNVPYLWGGRSARGIDCSGLVQVALEMAGIDAPRDGDMLRDLFCSREPTNLSRCDLVAMTDPSNDPHIGFMTRDDHLIHANANTHMAVVAEPLADLLARGYRLVAAGRP